MATDVLAGFLVVGGIIAIGFVARLIFERTRVPDILILTLLGVALGPVAAIFGVVLVPATVLDLATPFFTAIALMFLLFDGGLNLELGPVVKNLSIVSLHTGSTFLLTMLGVTFIATAVWGYPLLVGLLLGAVLGGTSSTFVARIVRPLHVSDETKTLLTLEAVMTDVLCVFTAVALIGFLRGGPNAPGWMLATEFGLVFVVSALLGTGVGIGWLMVLRRPEGKPVSYMLTVAVLFLLYATAEIMGGSGAMASFIFGLVLGNRGAIEKRLKLSALTPRGGTLLLDDRIKKFQSELSFVVRTFFFVFLGLVFTASGVVGMFVSTRLPVLDALNNTLALFLVGVVLIFLAIVAIRFVTATIVSLTRRKPREERRMIWTILGRGVTTAALASLPFTLPAFTSPATPGDAYYHALMAPLQAQFLNVAFFIILLTVGLTTFGVAWSGRAPKAARLAATRSADATKQWPGPP